MLSLRTDAAITWTDHQLGKAMDLMEELNQAEQTITVFHAGAPPHSRFPSRSSLSRAAVSLTRKGLAQIMAGSWGN